jgi:hypothetical protein
MDTAGIVMLDASSRRPIAAFYSASCGGTGLNTWNPVNIIGHTGCPCEKHGRRRHGHGHGGCQWGTNYLAQEGRNHREIIEFYFRNFSFVPNYGIESADDYSEVKAFIDSLETVEILGRLFVVKKH